MIPVRNKRITIVGAARSGLAAARLLRMHRAKVFVTDNRPARQMKAAAEELESIGVEFEFGKHTGRAIEADAIVLSPGVPSTAPPAVLGARKGVPVVSEIEIAAQFCEAPIVAVTGTNGKTTTTALAGEIFRRSGRHTLVAGNIGTAFSAVVADATPESVVVLEVSSFQLDHIRDFRPRVSVLLNITPDHLDRYPNFEAYVQSKYRITENQTDDDICVYNDDDPLLRPFAESLSIRTMPFSVEHKVRGGAYVRDGAIIFSAVRKEDVLMPTRDVRIPGVHNLYNSMAAALSARALEVTNATIRESLAAFEGVEHRLEFVRELDGVRYVNDSKATNVNSMWYALKSCDRPVILIAGGRGKGAPYAPVAPLVKESVRAMILIGEDADTIERELGSLTTVARAATLADAVADARKRAKKGDVVLLSPGCASFDMFTDYEDRGRQFKQLVQALT